MRSCRRAGGTSVTLSVNAVRKLDLNGDGREDYIVDFHEAECVGRTSFFCGTGGCDLLILVALRGGALRKVFDDRVREYEILSGRGPSEIRFVLHGSYCGGHGNPSCEKTRRITSEPFKFEQPNYEDNGAAVLLCSADSGGSSMKAIVTILGVVLLIVAAMYFLVPADSLPTFFPGHETGLMRIRAKHGMLAGGLGVVLLAASWFLGRK